MIVWISRQAKYEAKRRNDPELLERKRASRRKHHATHAERLNAARVERQRAKPEQHRAARHRYEASEKGRAAKSRYDTSSAGRTRNAERMRQRRATLREVPTERIVASEVFARDAGVCGICSQPVDPARYEIDHVVPLARGGEHTYANVQVAHPTCNRHKGARMEEAA